MTNFGDEEITKMIIEKSIVDAHVHKSKQLVLGFDFKHLTAKLEQAVVFEPSRGLKKFHSRIYVCIRYLCSLTVN